jgi:hypothetical protein
MPYSIETDNPGCRRGYAVVKDSDREVMGCHSTRRAARAQITALNIAESEQYRALPDNYRPALSADVPEGRACGNCIHYDESNVKEEDDDLLAYCTLWEDYVRGGWYCNKWQGVEVRQPSEPAPPEDQIEGSKVNEPGSAAGSGADIELNAATETALQNKSDAHNEAMNADDRPVWARVTVGKLRSVYRRGSGAYSTSHRPGISRQAWSMARVNAFLYLSRTGRPQNPRYIGDNDLLHPDHPRAPKPEQRQESYAPNDAMVREARLGLGWRQTFGRGGTEVGVARARDIVNRRNLSITSIARMISFFARHEVDKDAQGFRPGEDGYPSAGRIAWALWGGDAGRAWATRIMREYQSLTERSTSR